MTRGKKVGVVLILTGLCIPILALLFASGYSSRQDLIWNIQNTNVFEWEQTVPLPEKKTYTTEVFSKAETQGKIVPAGSIKLDKPTEDVFDKIEAKGKSEAHGPWEKYQNKGSAKVEYLGPLKNSNYDPLGLDRKTIRYAIPCSVFFGLGIILTATGIGFVVCSPKQ